MIRGLAVLAAVALFLVFASTWTGRPKPEERPPGNPVASAFTRALDIESARGSEKFTAALGLSDDGTIGQAQNRDTLFKVWLKPPPASKPGGRVWENAILDLGFDEDLNSGYVRIGFDVVVIETPWPYQRVGVAILDCDLDQTVGIKNSLAAGSRLELAFYVRDVERVPYDGHYNTVFIAWTEAWRVRR